MGHSGANLSSTYAGGLGFSSTVSTGVVSTTSGTLLTPGGGTSVTFTVPANGKVKGRFELTGKISSSSQSIKLGILNGAAEVYVAELALDTSYTRVGASFLITGLVAGTVTTWDLGYCSGDGVATASVFRPAPMILDVGSYNL